MLEVKEVCVRAKSAATEFAIATEADKNRILLGIGDALLAAEDELIQYNKTDVLEAYDKNRDQAFIDRLKLDHNRIVQMVDGLKAVVALKDPVGEVVEDYVCEGNGLHVIKRRVPLGVIAIIYEARPNVTVDAAALAIKSGNGVILRGSSEATRTNFHLIDIMRRAIKKMGFNNDIIGFIESSSRDKVYELLAMNQYVDVVIPRGGEELKNMVCKNATMPVIASSGGNCHVYVNKSVDIEEAYKILENGKINRPSTCNATETLLVDAGVAYKFLTYALPKLAEKGVKIRGSANIKSVFPETEVVGEGEFYREYNDYILKVAAVKDVDDAIKFINHFGTHHSDVICTTDKATAEKFLSQVDSAAVYWNASTRFTDGFELGLGAEMGISTQKIHCRGPIGLKELTGIKFEIYGKGQIRE